jgi:hypothetical protein
MADIEWTDKTCSPWEGCDKIAPDITWISAEPLLPPPDPWEGRLAEQDPPQHDQPQWVDDAVRVSLEPIRCYCLFRRAGRWRL